MIKNIYSATNQQRAMWIISLIVITFFSFTLVKGRFPLSGGNFSEKAYDICSGQSTGISCKINYDKLNTSSHNSSSSTKAPPLKELTKPVQTSKSMTSTTWKLRWNDEFNGPTLDTTKWTVLNGGKFYTPATSEYYAPDDTYIQNNALILKSEQRSYNGFKYTSGGISSQDKFSLLYGKIEWREQLPKGQGLWPAIWLMPESGAALLEVDLLELIGSNPHDILMNYHWQDSSGDKQQNMTHFIGPDFSASAHVFDLQWTPGELDWYIDGVLKKTVTSNVSNMPMFIYINTAVGADGTWPGLPDNTTVFPQYTKIDYIRVYQAN